MAKNIFKVAKTVQRANPKLSWQQAIQKASALNKKPAAKKPAAKKKRKVGAYKVIEKNEKRSAPVKKVVQVVRTKKGLFKGFKQVNGIKVGSVPGYADPILVRDLVLQIDNERTLFDRYRAPVMRSLAKKYKAGTFDVNKAAEAFLPYIAAGMMWYTKENMAPRTKWYTLLTPAERRMLAKQYAIEALGEFKAGNVNW
jgi:hypothetical protein